MNGIGKSELEVGTWCMGQIIACLRENSMGISLKEVWRWCSYREGETKETGWSDFMSAFDALEQREIVKTDRDAGGNIKWVLRGEKWPAEKRARRS